MALLDIVNICKTYSGRPALDAVSLSLERGNILALLGPSGCGKTTLLRIIAGLEAADRGKIVFDGRDVGPIAPHRRQFGMMFQEFALFPHKNVFENVAFGLQIQNLATSQIDRQTQGVLNLVGLQGFGDRHVSELSGGERQRVALARSLAPHPRLLMLDEPLGSLDRSLRERLMLDLRRILKKVGVSTIFVTHDQAEAFSVADAVAVFHEGRIQQVDLPDRIYKQPANAYVAQFLGFHNLLNGTVMTDGAVKTDIGNLHPPLRGFSPGARVTVLLRPEAARLIADPSTADRLETVLRARVRDALFRGRHYQWSVETEDFQILVFEFSAETIPPPADHAVFLALRSSAMQVLPCTSGVADGRERENG